MPKQAHHLHKTLQWPLFKTGGEDRKAPSIHKGTSWQDRRNHHPLTDKLLKGARNAKWGLAAPIPEDVIVIDIDERKALKRLCEAIKFSKLLQTTLAVKTGNGYHLYYKRPKKFEVRQLKKKVKAFRNIDIRAHGMYMVVPPSIHHTGVPYEQIDNPHDTPQPMPKALRKYIKASVKALNEQRGGALTSSDLDAIANESVEPFLSFEDFQTLLDSLSPEDFTDMQDEFVPLLLSCHYTMRGSKKAREMFIDWARNDVAYNTDKHVRVNRVMWNTAKL